MGASVCETSWNAPAAGHLRQAVKELERLTFVLATDSRRAHRRVKIKEDERGLQACKASRNATHEWVNAVGSFGIASIAVHWLRLFGGLQGVVYHILGSKALFLLACVDDILWFAPGGGATDASGSAIVSSCNGVAIFWKKC